jgi:hypothetical protein
MRQQKRVLTNPFSLSDYFDSKIKQLDFSNLFKISENSEFVKVSQFQNVHLVHSMAMGNLNKSKETTPMTTTLHSIKGSTPEDHFPQIFSKNVK